MVGDVLPLPELNQSSSNAAETSEAAVETDVEIGTAELTVPNQVGLVVNAMGARDISEFEGGEDLQWFQQAAVSFKIEELENLASIKPEEALEEFLKMLASSEDMKFCSQEYLQRILAKVELIQSVLRNPPRASELQSPV